MTNDGHLAKRSLQLSEMNYIMMCAVKKFYTPVGDRASKLQHTTVECH